MEKSDKNETYCGLQGIYHQIKQLALQYQLTCDEKAKRIRALEIFSDILNLLTGLATSYGSSEKENKLLNLHLKAVLIAMEALYETTQKEPSLKDLERELIENAALQISGNRWFVQNVVDQFLLDHCDKEYEVGTLRNRVLNDLLWLAIRPSIQLTKSTALEIKAFYVLVRDELRQQPFPPGYVVSSRWQQIIDRLISMVDHIEDSMHIAVLGMHGSPFYTHVKQLDAGGKSRFQKQRSLIHKHYPELAPIGESDLSLPGTTVDVEGISISNGFSQCLNFYTEIMSRLGSSTPSNVIVEIGSGFGRLARVFRLSGRCRCYVLVDLPESLLFAYAFLKANFPEASFHVIRSPKDVHPEMTQNFDFIFCPVQQFANLKISEVDLLINTWSFGEMQQGCVDHLLDVVQKVILPKYLFSMNTMFLDRELHAESSGGSGQYEAIEVVLNVQPMWWPISFNLHNAQSLSSDNCNNYKNAAVLMLKRITSTKFEIIKELLDESNKYETGTNQWLRYMYFAALWTSNETVINEFLSGLKIWMENMGVHRMAGYNFEKIGEVRYLRRRQESLALPIST